MAEARIRRWWVLPGVLFFVFYALGFIVFGGGTPSDKAPGDKVVSYFHSHSGGSKVATLLIVAAAVSLVFFAGHLRHDLRQAGGDDPLPSVLFGGGVITAAGLLFMAAVRFALVKAADNGQPDVARVLNLLDNNDFFLVVGGVATLFLAAGLAILDRSLLPKWIGVASIVLGVLTLAGPLGVLGLFLLPVWVLVISVLLARAESPTGTTRQV